MTSSGKPPKHQRIANELRERIRSGELLPGTSLPSQRQLSVEFSVTLMTLRQALHSLEKEGMIVLQPGRGTFVGPFPIARQGHGLRSLADELDTQGVKLTTAVMAQGLRALPASVAAHLNQTPGSSALRLERLRSVRGLTLMHQVSWVPSPWHAQLIGVDFSQESLYGALATRASLVIFRAEEVLEAEILRAQPAKRLGVAAGRPALVTERTTYDHQGTAIVHDRAVVLNDRLRVTTERHLVGDKLNWALRYG